MADEVKSPEQLQQDMFQSTQVPLETPAEVTPEPSPSPAESPAPVPPPEAKPPEAPETAIPSWRLREEADARRTAEDRARALEARLTEIQQHLQQSQKQPDFFENPNAATEALIARHMQPIVENTRQQLMYMGKMVASTMHGADKVDEAERAFLEARDRATLDPADYERVVQSPNRYDAVVQWHRRQSVLSSVGDDPAAWFEKQLEARMADPQFQAKMLEKVRGDAAKRPAATSLPPSLSRATAAAGNREEPLGDMSDASLFAYAMKPADRRRGG
jgi:hypothetical protein